MILKGVAKGGGIGGTQYPPALACIHSKKDCEKRKKEKLTEKYKRLQILMIIDEKTNKIHRVNLERTFP